MTELQDVEFSGEEKITILGYDKNGMEVDITADGEVLMFNDRVKDGPPNKNIHWASRIDDKTYQYEGEVTEINTDEVDGTPSFDAGGNVYFTSLGSYFPAPGNTDAFKSIYKGSFDGRHVTNVSIVENLYVGEIRWISLDPDISNSGRFLFYTHSHTGDTGFFDLMDIRGATSNPARGFDRIDDALFANINTDKLEYAPTISNDGLEMYFTRADLSTATILGIFKTTRASVDEAFAATGATVSAITGIVEAPSFNGDETALYYHREVGGVFEIFRVTRALPAECQ